jgi:hypothetical protein
VTAQSNGRYSVRADIAADEALAEAASAGEAIAAVMRFMPTSITGAV